jgi:PKD repeat protein
MRRIAPLLLGMAAFAAAAAPASAQVQPAGTGEPAFTNSTQNTQFFEWPASAGADAYRIRFDYYENNALKASPTYPELNGGSLWANWSGVATLQHGGQYGICAQGEFSLPNDSLFYPDGPSSCSMATMLGRRAYTTIDRSKPNAAIHLAADAAFVKDTKIPLRIDFADDVAGPFPANFLCFQAGGSAPCEKSTGAIYGYNAACSAPGSGGKSTTFSCTADYGEIADGTVWACAIAADASIPDNPSGPDQRASAERANLSAPSCDSVVLDRTPPTVSIATASSSVKAGALVSFQATMADAASGLAGAGTWAWGDGTRGDAATHTYTRSGTYEVSLTVTDAAGNAATAKQAITVTAISEDTPPAGGGGTGTPPAGGTTAPPASHDEQAPAELDVDAPRKVRARAKAIPVEVTASDDGRVQLSLSRGARVIARAGIRLDADGTADYRLKLPKGLKAGRYTLKAAYRGVTVSRSVTLTGKPPARRARASSLPGAALGPGPRALPDGRFHGPRPAPVFSVPLSPRTAG